MRPSHPPPCWILISKPCRPSAPRRRVRARTKEGCRPFLPTPAPPPPSPGPEMHTRPSPPPLSPDPLSHDRHEPLRQPHPPPRPHPTLIASCARGSGRRGAAPPLAPPPPAARRAAVAASARAAMPRSGCAAPVVRSHMPCGACACACRCACARGTAVRGPCERPYAACVCGAAAALRLHARASCTCQRRAAPGWVRGSCATARPPRPPGSGRARRSSSPAPGSTHGIGTGWKYTRYSMYKVEVS